MRDYVRRLGSGALGRIFGIRVITAIAAVSFLRWIPGTTCRPDIDAGDASKDRVSVAQGKIHEDLRVRQYSDHTATLATK